MDIIDELIEANIEKFSKMLGIPKPDWRAVEIYFYRRMPIAYYNAWYEEILFNKRALIRMWEKSITF